MYRQYMKNPKGIIEEFGSDLTIYELLEQPRIKQNLDYYDSLMKWAKVVGENNIVLRRYPHDVVSEFATFFGRQR